MNVRTDGRLTCIITASRWLAVAAEAVEAEMKDAKACRRHQLQREAAGG